MKATTMSPSRGIHIGSTKAPRAAKTMLKLLQPSKMREACRSDRVYCSGCVLCCVDVRTHLYCDIPGKVGSLRASVGRAMSPTSMDVLNDIRNQRGTLLCCSVARWLPLPRSPAVGGACTSSAAAALPFIAAAGGLVWGWDWGCRRLDRGRRPPSGTDQCGGTGYAVPSLAVQVTIAVTKPNAPFVCSPPPRSLLPLP